MRMRGGVEDRSEIGKREGETERRRRGVEEEGEERRRGRGGGERRRRKGEEKRRRGGAERGRGVRTVGGEDVRNREREERSRGRGGGGEGGEVTLRDLAPEPQHPLSTF